MKLGQREQEQELRYLRDPQEYMKKRCSLECAMDSEYCDKYCKEHEEDLTAQSAEVLRQKEQMKRYQ